VDSRGGLAHTAGGGGSAEGRKQGWGWRTPLPFLSFLSLVARRRQHAVL